ncbi:MAG: tetratricopeptide repeat protein [Desulfomonilaceae bacterium]
MSPTAAFGAADLAYDQGRYRDAVKLYAEAAKDISRRGPALLKRGMTYEMMNQPLKAVEDYKDVLRLDRENYQALENLAGIYERGGKYIAEAITLYRCAMKLDPRPEWKENLAAWIAMLETRLRPLTSFAVGCWHLANRRARAGDVQGAEALYSRAISLDPAMFVAYYRRGLLRKNNGNLSGALADFDATVGISPSFRGGLVQKGLTNEQMGNRDQAREDFEQAVRVDPHDPEALYYLALALENANELERAIQLYQRALGYHPGPQLRVLVSKRIKVLAAKVVTDEKKGSTSPNSRRQR